MKNKAAALLLSTVFAFPIAMLPASVSAQSIQQGTLGTAQEFDAGTINFASGGLDPALWSGTNAATAKSLIDAAPIGSKNPLIADMVRTVILTGGVPPQGADTAYGRARLSAVMRLNDPAALDGVSRRLPELTADSAVRADLALASGDSAAACTMADSVTEGRGEPTWARLRAFCHTVRGEIPAAELTANLLKKSGYEDALFYSLMNRLTGVSKEPLPGDLGADPLYKAMAGALVAGDDEKPSVPVTASAAAALAKDQSADKDLRLSSLFAAGAALSDGDIEGILNGLIYDGVEVEDLDAASNFDIDTAMSDKSALGFAQLFQLTKRGSGPAMTALLKRAKAAGALPRFANLLTLEITNLQAGEKIDGLALYADIAVIQDDIAALQSLFTVLPEGEPKTRIAFAADAIGQGFRLGTLGQDIESRLGGVGAKGQRALRDALIALSLGAVLSESGAAGLTGAKTLGGREIPAGDLAILRSVSKAGSRAETTLRAAKILDGSRLNAEGFAAVIDALSTAQLNDFAGRLAAQDFLSTLD